MNAASFTVDPTSRSPGFLAQLREAVLQRHQIPGEFALVAHGPAEEAGHRMEVIELEVQCSDTPLARQRLWVPQPPDGDSKDSVPPACTPKGREELFYARTVALLGIHRRRC